jgi:hypothetical protein
MSVLATLAVLAGCSSTNKAAPPPTGGFSNTNLSGTYVFSTAGEDSNLEQPEFLAMVGTFTACGCAAGTISGGVVDMNDPDTLIFTAGPVKQLAITGGSYSVGVDGRGKASLSAATPFGSSIELDFVLSSSQGGLVTEFDTNGSGSGTLDLQSSPAQTAGTYVFNLAGIAGVSQTTGFGIPLATVGSVALDGSGNATAAGVQDLNNSGTDSLLTVAMSSTIPVGTSPTTATLVTSGGTFTFDVYAIDSTHFKLIETDPAPILVGDVFSQSTSAFPSGELAFAMAGLDFVSSGPLAVGGMMDSNGTSTLSPGVEDFNDVVNGVGVSNINLTSNPQVITPLAFTGGISPSTPPVTGRYLVTFNSGFENGNGGNATIPYTFAAYPSTGGTQLLEIDGLGITGGVAYPQNSTSFASGQGYGLNLTGSDGSEVDDIAEFTNSNNVLSGLIDVNNDQAIANSTGNFNGTYTPDTTNLGRGLITTTNGGINLVSYTVDSTNSIFIEIDPDQVAVGSIGQQAAASQGAITTRMAVLRPRALARGAWKKRPAADSQGR